MQRRNNTKRGNSCSVIWLRLLPLIWCNYAHCYRYVNDDVAEPNTAPYQVSLYHLDQGHTCSGAIIGRQWVITAARCVYNVDTSKILVLAGNQDLRFMRNAQAYDIDYVITHGYFDLTKGLNDIGLIRTKSKFKYSSLVEPIDLYREQMPPESWVTLTGWNWRKLGYQEQLKLRKVDVQTITHKECKKIFIYKPHKKVDAGHMCLNVGSDPAYCNKEAGSPLVYKMFLVGITSHGPACANGEPYIASSLQFYYDFVEIKTRGCNSCPDIKEFKSLFFSNT